MYGLLLMTALATGGDTASFGGRFSGCSGCSGCTGAVVTASCYGCGGCNGYMTSCSGCSGYTNSTSCGGGGLFSGLRARFATHTSSCQGSACSGSSCYGSSCCGGYGSSCCGGWGACYGNTCGGSVIVGQANAASAHYYGNSTWSQAPVSNYGPAYTYGPRDTVVNHQPMSAQLNANSQALNAGWWANAPRSYGVNYQGVYYSGENYAAWPNGGVGVRTFSPGYTFGGGYATGVVGPYFYGADHRPYVAQGPIPGTLAKPLYVPATVPVIVPEFEVAKANPSVSAPAKLTVELPAEAKFFVDGVLTKGEGTQRNFHTPELPHGKTFFYDLKAEVTVEGKLVVESKRVLVRGGEDITETFPKLIAAARNSPKEPTAVATTK